jgi:hypothetical protein
MPDDKTEILKAITELTKVVETYHGDFREFRGEMSTKVKSLEDNDKSTRLWQKIQAVCVIPVTGGLHQLAQYLHWIK